MSEAADFTLKCGAGRAALGGIMRLESVEAYDRELEPVRLALEATTDPFTIDVTALVFLNSSGIRALGDLVLAARDRGQRLILVGSAAIPWQKKTFASLSRIHDGIETRLA